MNTSNNNAKNTILIVNNDDAFSTFVQENLRAKGYNTARTSNKTETIDWLSDNRADLMLLDHLPGDTTSETLVENLRKQNPRTPFVVVSERGNAGVAANMIESGEIDYIVKNDNLLGVLLKTIKRAIEKPKQESTGKQGEGMAGHVISSKDVTKQKNMAKKIEALAKFPSENPNPVLRVSKDRTLLYGNKASKPILKKWNCKQGQKLSEKWQQLINETLKSNLPRQIEFDCQQQIFSLTLTPVVDADYVNIYALEITDKKQNENEKEKLFHDTQKRIKELRCMYSVARSIRQRDSLDDIFHDVVNLIPHGWHYPEITKAKIRFGNKEFVSGLFEETQWKITTDIIAYDDICGSVEVFYLEERPEMDEGPFMREETNLINGIARSLSDAVERTISEKEVQKSYKLMEDKVKERTLQLQKTVTDLQAEVIERIKDEAIILDDQKQLRKMASELMTIEERERRKIANALHDSIGQILAFSSIELGTLMTKADENSAKSLKKVRLNIEKAITETRKLTYELSPAVLYSFGLNPAIEHLSEQFSLEHNLTCQFETDNEPVKMSTKVELFLYRATRELLTNIAKHAKAKNASIKMRRIDDNLEISVSDDGQGFDMFGFNAAKGKPNSIGLLSIKERLTHIGGELKIYSMPGKETIITMLAPLEQDSEEEKK